VKAGQNPILCVDLRPMSVHWWWKQHGQSYLWKFLNYSIKNSVYDMIDANCIRYLWPWIHCVTNNPQIWVENNSIYLLICACGSVASLSYTFCFGSQSWCTLASSHLGDRCTEHESTCVSALLAASLSTFAGIPLAKASHMAKLKIKGQRSTFPTSWGHGQMWLLSMTTKNGEIREMSQCTTNP
jgi:hypothetical protein